MKNLGTFGIVFYFAKVLPYIELQNYDNQIGQREFGVFVFSRFNCMQAYGRAKLCIVTFSNLVKARE